MHRVNGQRRNGRAIRSQDDRTPITPLDDLTDLYRLRFYILQAVYRAAIVSKANVDRRVRKAEHDIVALLDGPVSSVTQIHLQDATVAVVLGSLDVGIAKPESDLAQMDVRAYSSHTRVIEREYNPHYMKHLPVPISLHVYEPLELICGQSIDPTLRATSRPLRPG